MVFLFLGSRLKDGAGRPLSRSHLLQGKHEDWQALSAVNLYVKGSITLEITRYTHCATLPALVTVA